MTRQRATLAWALTAATSICLLARSSFRSWHAAACATSAWCCERTPRTQSMKRNARRQRSARAARRAFGTGRLLTSQRVRRGTPLHAAAAAVTALVAGGRCHAQLPMTRCPVSANTRGTPALPLRLLPPLLPLLLQRSLRHEQQPRPPLLQVSLLPTMPGGALPRSCRHPCHNCRNHPRLPSAATVVRATTRGHPIRRRGRGRHATARDTATRGTAPAPASTPCHAPAVRAPAAGTGRRHRHVMTVTVTDDTHAVVGARETPLTAPSLAMHNTLLLRLLTPVSATTAAPTPLDSHAVP